MLIDARRRGETRPPENAIEFKHARTGRPEMPSSGEQPLLEAEGNGGHIWLFADKVRIKHHGLRGALTKGVLKGDNGNLD